MAFHGWSAEALDFFDGLTADNSKAYWNSHRKTYDEQVHAPMAALLAELEPEFGSGRIMRPYRDTRFSTDKSPYKTQLAAMLDCGGYIQLSANGLGIGCGMYMMTPDQLTRYRQSVDDECTGKQLEDLAIEIRSHGIVVDGSEKLKTTPRGFAKDHPRIDLLRNKGLVAWLEWPVEPWLATAEVKPRAAEFLRTTARLTEWLEANVGPSQSPSTRR